MSASRTGLSAWAWDRKHGVEYGPKGYRLCRLCKAETTYKRATLCSEACREKWALMTSPSYARQRVYQRDKGVCALCGLDTEGLRKHIGDAKAGGLRSWSARYGLMLGRVSLWDADHIVPVVEGGGECDLSNLQTLCLWCHRKKTAEMAKRRAAARKGTADAPAAPTHRQHALPLEATA